jgi:hypothetical protein
MIASPLPLAAPSKPPGLWRGGQVAIKVMILPARMSGAEKKERMALMEAAISSVLQHPNIVQVCRWRGCGACPVSGGG